MFRFAPEGYPYIAFFGIVAIIAFMAGGAWTALLPFILTLFMLYFFRDPERDVPEGEGIFVAPADGKVILISKIPGDSLPSLISEDSRGHVMISIFMSPLDVHVNRSPCDGVVESVLHTPGRFISAFKPEASTQNENIAMVLSTKYGRVLVRQVAGFIARRAVCRVKAGDALKGGGRYGVIKFSSRVDIYLPEGARVMVGINDRVKAGETVIGRI
ncbi:MAG: phosphatidylserine decarboxylase family protein [Nitrospirota bacterium]